MQEVQITSDDDRTGIGIPAMIALKGSRYICNDYKETKQNNKR